MTPRRKPEPVIVVHLNVGPNSDLRKLCDQDEPADLELDDKEFRRTPRQLCKACYKEHKRLKEMAYADH